MLLGLRRRGLDDAAAVPGVGSSQSHLNGPGSDHRRRRHRRRRRAARQRPVYWLSMNDKALDAAAGLVAFGQPSDGDGQPREAGRAALSAMRSPTSCPAWITSGSTTNSPKGRSTKTLSVNVLAPMPRAASALPEATAGSPPAQHGLRVRQYRLSGLRRVLRTSRHAQPAGVAPGTHRYPRACTTWRPAARTPINSPAVSE